MEEIDRKIYEYNQEVICKYSERSELTESEKFFVEQSKLSIKKIKEKYHLN